MELEETAWISWKCSVNTTSAGIVTLFFIVIHLLSVNAFFILIPYKGMVGRRCKQLVYFFRI